MATIIELLQALAASGAIPTNLGGGMAALTGLAGGISPGTGPGVPDVGPPPCGAVPIGRLPGFDLSKVIANAGVNIPGLTTQTTAPQTNGFDLSQLLAMSDEDLLAFANQLGVDSTPFTVGAFTGISPEARAEVENIYNAQRTKGNEELLRMATTAAGRRGLNMMDTPIMDPLLRQKAAFESELGGMQSQSLINLNESLRNFYENMRQFQTEQGRLGEQSQRSFLQNVYSTQEALAQQAFANRLQLAQQSGQLASNLAGQRLGFGTGSTTQAPTNIGAGIGAIGAGFQSLFGQPQTSFTINPNFQPNSSSMFIPSTQTSLFG